MNGVESRTVLRPTHGRPHDSTALPWAKRSWRSNKCRPYRSRLVDCLPELRIRHPYSPTVYCANPAYRPSSDEWRERVECDVRERYPAVGASRRPRRIAEQMLMTAAHETALTRETASSRVRASASAVCRNRESDRKECRLHGRAVAEVRKTPVHGASASRLAVSASRSALERIRTRWCPSASMR